MPDTQLLIECSPAASLPAGAVAHALYEARGIPADAVGAMERVAEGVVVSLRGVERTLRGPVVLRVPIGDRVVPLRARRLDEPPHPTPRPLTVRLLPVGGEAVSATPGQLADALAPFGVAAEDLGRVVEWEGGLELELPATRVRPSDLPQTVEVGGTSFALSTGTSRSAHAVDTLVSRFLQSQGEDGEAALREALLAALSGDARDPLPDLLSLAAKKKSPMTASP